MQPNTVTLDGNQYRAFVDENGVIFPAAPINTYALRRVFNLATNTPKTVDLADLTGFWEVESLYISSPEDSEVKVEIVDSNGIAFFEDILKRNETPKKFPVVLLDSNLTVRVTARRNNINLLLLYLKPAHLQYMKDF